MADMPGNQDTSSQLSSSAQDTWCFHLQTPDDSVFSPRQSKNCKTNYFLSICPLLSHSTELASASLPLFWLVQHHHLFLFLTVANSGRPLLCPSLKDLIHCSSYREIFSFSVPCVVSQRLEFFFSPSGVSLLDLCSGLIYSQRRNTFYPLCMPVFYVAHLGKGHVLYKSCK